MNSELVSMIGERRRFPLQPIVFRTTKAMDSFALPNQRAMIVDVNGFRPMAAPLYPVSSRQVVTFLNDWAHHLVSQGQPIIMPGYTSLVGKGGPRTTFKMRDCCDTRCC